MSIEGEAVMPPQTFKSLIRLLSRKYLVTLRVAGGLFAVPGLVGLAFALSRGLDDLAGAAVTCIAFGLVIALLIPWLVVNRAVRRSAGVLAGPRRYEIGDSGIRLTTPLVSVEWPWTSVAAIDEHQDFWLIRTVEKGAFVAVLKAGFTEAGRRELADLFRRRRAG